MKGYVYLLHLYVNDHEYHYYGSTINPVTRLRRHKKDYNNYINRIILPVNIEMEILEEMEIINYLDVKLRIREQFYMDNFDCINSEKGAYTSKEKRKEQEKTWRKNRTEEKKLNDKIKEKKWREKNRDYIKEIHCRRLSCKVCKQEMSYKCFKQHCKSKKHQNNLLESII